MRLIVLFLVCLYIPLLLVIGWSLDWKLPELWILSMKTWWTRAPILMSFWNSRWSGRNTAEWTAKPRATREMDIWISILGLVNWERYKEGASGIKKFSSQVTWVRESRWKNLTFGYFISSQVHFGPFPMALFPSAVISVLIVWGPKLADPVIKKIIFIRSFLTEYMPPILTTQFARKPAIIPHSAIGWEVKFDVSVRVVADNHQLNPNIEDYHQCSGDLYHDVSFNLVISDVEYSEKSIHVVTLGVLGVHKFSHFPKGVQPTWNTETIELDHSSSLSRGRKPGNYFFFGYG